MTRLLVTGGGGAGAPLLWRFWGQIYEVYFADCDPLACPPEIPFQRFHQIPRAGEPHFPEALAELCRKLEIDLLIPAVDEELPIMPLLRREGIDVLLPDEWYVHIMLDKLASMRELEKRGIPVPRTVIAKPRQGRGSRDVYVEQERLGGQEYTVQMVADRNGNLRAIVPVRVDVKRGVTIRGTSTPQFGVMVACGAIHEALPFVGCVNVQGILTEERGFIPFEINPRISTTTGLALAGGIDPVAIWFAPTPPVLTKWELFQPVSLHRTWQNTIRYT